MASHNEDSSCDDTTSSLGDNSYDFIDDRSNATTDDEEHDHMTESISSSNGQEFDQPDVPAQADVTGVTRNKTLQTQNSASSSSQDNRTDSELTSNGQASDIPAGIDRFAPQNLDDRQEAIVFVEPSITNLNFSRVAQVSHILKVIDDSHAPISEIYRDMRNCSLGGKVAVSLRQSMTGHGLDLGGKPYKMLYVGEPNARDAIVQKIATALAATMGDPTHGSKKSCSSRFNIIPISAFGEQASPEVVLIDSSGLEMNVEDCNFASFSKRDGGNDTIRIQLSDGNIVESTWSGSSFVVSSNWRMPDIAVFCFKGSDSIQAKLTRRIVRSFMSRHGVQSLIITQESYWEAPPETISLDYLTPHIHLESVHARGVMSTVAKRMRRIPIDLTTFLSIDAGQLNRNLACLAAANGSSKPRTLPKAKKYKAATNGDYSSWREIFDEFVSDIRTEGLKGLNRYEYTAGLAVMLLSVLGMVVVGFGLTGILGASRVSNSRVFPTNAITLPASGIATSSLASMISHTSTSTLTASLASSTPAKVSPIKSLSTDTDIASLLDAYTLAPNKSEQFKVHILGDCHIVLRLPHWLSKVKKAPKLFFKVTRGNNQLEHLTTTLFDGVYALQIPREESYGVLNVVVWTEAKPKINENFEMDFGSSWFKVAGWEKASRVMTESIIGNLNSVQTSLSIVCDHTKTRLSRLLQQHKEKMTAQREVEKAVLRARWKCAAQMTDHIVGQTKALVRGISNSLNGSRVAASRQVVRHAESFTKELTVYAHNKSTMISRYPRILARAATNMNAKAITSELAEIRRRHLRETQKKALKIWWKVGGVPKQITRNKSKGATGVVNN